MIFFSLEYRSGLDGSPVEVCEDPHAKLLFSEHLSATDLTSPLWFLSHNHLLHVTDLQALVPS